MKPFTKMTLGELLLAFEKDPQSPDVNYAIGRKLMALEKYKVSIEYFQTCIALRPKFPEAYLALAELFEKTGELSTAQGFRTAAEKLFQEIDRDNAAKTDAPPDKQINPQPAAPGKPRSREPRDIPATELLELPPPEPDESSYATHEASSPAGLHQPVSLPWSSHISDAAVTQPYDSDSPDTKIWYYQFAGEEQGPCTIEDLRNKAQSGDIHRDTLIWRMGFRAWRRAADVEDMQPVLHTRPQSIPELLGSTPAPSISKPAAPVDQARVVPQEAAPVPESETIPEPLSPAQEPEPVIDALLEPVARTLSVEPSEPVTESTSVTPAPSVMIVEFMDPAAPARAVPVEDNEPLPETHDSLLTVPGPDSVPEESPAAQPDPASESFPIAGGIQDAAPEPSDQNLSAAPEIPPAAVEPVAPIPEPAPRDLSAESEPDPAPVEPIPAQPEARPEAQHAPESTDSAATPLAQRHHKSDTTLSSEDLLRSEVITFEDLLPKSAKRSSKKKLTHEKPEREPRPKKAPRKIRESVLPKTGTDPADAAKPAKPAPPVLRPDSLKKFLNAASTLAAIIVVAVIMVRAWEWYKGKTTPPPRPPSQTVEQYIDALHRQDQNALQDTFTNARAQAIREQDQSRDTFVASDFVTRSAVSPDMRFKIKDVSKKSGQAVVQGVLTVPNSPEIDMKFVLVLEDNQWKIHFVDENIQGALRF